MEVYGQDQNTGSLQYFTTGQSSDFICGLAAGHVYEARPIGQTFSDFSCKELANTQGVLCWRGNPVDCTDGNSHVRYYKTSEGAFQAESNPGTWQWCSQDTGQSKNLFSYLEEGFGVGGSGPGYQTDPTDPPQPSLPDFVTNKVWFTTPWQSETYTYGLPETVQMHAQFQNIGTVGCTGTIEVHFYLSEGYKEDPHSGPGSWKRVGTDFIQCDHLQPGQTHSEEEGMTLSVETPAPGINNVVACIDHP
jgi:hypothetical protein